MAETQNPEIQQVSFDDLSKKIQETTDELNKLKNWLNNSSSNQLDITQLRQQSDKLSSIEITILECSYALINLEKDWSLAVEKAQLDELKSQIDALNLSKESIKKQINTQTEAALAELNQAVTGKEKKRLWRQRDAVTSKQEWKDHTWKNILRTLWWVWVVAWVWTLLWRIFWGRRKEESESGWKTRRELRRERRQQRREERKQRREERQKNMEELEKRAEEIWKKLEDPPRWAKIFGIWEKKS